MMCTSSLFVPPTSPGDARILKDRPPHLGSYKFRKRKIRYLYYLQKRLKLLDWQLEKLSPKSLQNFVCGTGSRLRGGKRLIVIRAVFRGAVIAEMSSNIEAL